MFEKRLAKQLQGSVRKGRLTVHFANGQTVHCGEDSADYVSCGIKFASAEAARRCYFDPELAFAECYVDGQIEIVEGSVSDFFRLLMVNRNQLVSVWAIINGLKRVVQGALPKVGSIGQSSKDVTFHYDSDALLFSSFLDQDMNYSCAYFRTPEDTLEQAQRNKQDKIIRKLDLRDGGRVLDIGCGWGSMAMRLAQAADVEVMGVTLSEKQAEVARQRVADAGLSDRVSIQVQDYRTLDGGFDHICSIGMMEHVGKRRLGEYFHHVDRLMVKTGTALIHAIHRTKPTPYNQAFTEAYIFPGGYIPSVAETSKAVEQNNILIRDVDIWPIHYATTIAEWRRRFIAAQDKLRPHLGERNFRIWEVYLTATELGFLVQRLFVAQFLLSKHNDRVSRTREDYL